MRARRAPNARVGVLALGTVLWSGCGPAAVLVCTAAPGRPLPEEIIETSGAAWSGREAGLFWTHNDGREGVLYAVDTTGALRARVELEGVRVRDAEDLAAAPCGDSHCLYLADTGDNQERRSTVQILRLEEPTLEAQVATVDRFPVSFPGGPRDVEALVVLPGERLYLVSKGRREPITVYRYPGPLQPDSLVVLERVRALDDRPPAFASRISGASAVPGRDDLLLIRSYDRLRLVEMREDGPRPYPNGELNLIPLLEAQGEAVSVRSDGRVVLTSEAGPLTPVPGMRLLQCTFPAERTSGD